MLLDSIKLKKTLYLHMHQKAASRIRSGHDSHPPRFARSQETRPRSLKTVNWQQPARQHKIYARSDSFSTSHDMTSFPWITFETSRSGNIVTHYEPELRPALSESQADNVERNYRPSFVTFVGRRSKAILLDRLLGGDLAVPVHKEVYLWSLPRQNGSPPCVIIDCGMQNSQSQPPNPSAARSATPATSWSLPEIRNVSATLCARVFSPFSSVICCFVSDLGGPKAVANWLADFADAATARDLPTVPRILLVVETTSDTFDESIATSKAIAYL